MNRRIGPHVFQNIGAGRENSLAAQCYVDQILIMPIFMCPHSQEFHQNAAASHTARVTIDFPHQFSIRIRP